MKVVGSIYISYVSVQFYLIIGTLWEAVRNKMDPHFCQHLAYLYLESFFQKVKISVLKEVMSKDTHLLSSVFSSCCRDGRVTQFLIQKKFNEVSRTAFCSFVFVLTSCQKETPTWLTPSLQENLPFYPVVKNSCFILTRFPLIFEFSFDNFTHVYNVLYTYSPTVIPFPFLHSLQLVTLLPPVILFSVGFL